MKITIGQLADLLKWVENPTFVGVTYSTEYVRGKNLSASAPEAVYVKTEKAVFMIGQSYQNAVSNALLKRGQKVEAKTFTPQPRKWGVHEGKSLIEHKGVYYLQVRSLKNSRRGSSYETPAGIPVKYGDIASYFRARPEAPEHGVYFRDIKLSNIKTITLMGQTYEIE